MNWLRRLAGRRDPDDELADEIRAHIDEKTDALIAAGMSRADARAAARRAFGNVGNVKETSHDLWVWPALESLTTDVRFAFRLLRRHPGFSANVVLIAALGVAACATTFSLVSGILLKPLPFASPDRVHFLALRTPDGGETFALPVDGYRVIEHDSTVLAGVAASAPGSVTVTLNDEPQRWDTERITASFFRTWGVKPMLGREFTGDDVDQGVFVAMLSNRTWRTRYGSDSSVVGKAIVLSDVAYTIVGVMPPRFRAHFYDEPDVWLPMRMDGNRDANAVLRLRDGVTKERAESWLASAARWTQASPTRRGERIAAMPELVPSAEQIYGYVVQPLRILLGAVILVVLLVSANVATMFLARANARDRELGMRRALGASVIRQVRQLVTESLVLTGIGGVTGIVASYWTIGVIRELGTRVLPRLDDVTLDWRVTAFACVATALMGVAGGLAPAMLSRRETTFDASGGRIIGTRTSSALVVAQVTLSVVLVVGAGLLVKSFVGAVPSNPGFAVENRAVLTVQLRGRAEYAANVQQRQFIADVSQRMRAVPGVLDVGAMSFAPFSGAVSRYDVELPGEGTPERPYRVYQNIVTPGLMRVMDIELRRGRGFAPADVDGTPRVAIINETAAGQWFPGQDAIGKTFMLPERDRLTLTVVGVMGDMQFSSRDRRGRPEAFVPVAQESPVFLTFVAHTRGDPTPVLPLLKRAVWSVAPKLHVGYARSLESFTMDSVSEPRFYAWSMGFFAIAAVALSGLGVYGLLSFAVTQRQREIGIRLAIGATPARVGWDVVRRALVLGTTGVVIGVAIARGVTHYLSGLLREVSTTDVTVFIAGAAAVCVIAVVAACAPAYHAVRVDPMRTLRA